MMPHRKKARQHAPGCPNDKARVTNHPVEYLHVELDGMPYRIDKWKSVKYIVDPDSDPGMMRTVAELMAVYFCSQPGADQGITGQAVIDTFRDLSARGVVGIGADGRAYMGEPIYDALGRVTGSKRLTDAFRAEVSAEIARHLRAGDAS